MYYLLIIIAVLMFGGCFALNDEYRKLRSSSFTSSMESSFVGSIAGLVVLLFVSGLHFEVTIFTLFMAACASLCGIGFTFCSFKALDKVNLSLYSLFSMLGGMALPFFQGILFFEERFTNAKKICFVLISIALLLTVSKGKSKKGTIYYVGVFMFNGLAGVLSKIFVSAPFEKTSSKWYSIWIAIFTIVISGMLRFGVLRKKEMQRYTWKALGISSMNGVLNRVANLLLVIALAHVDTSVQYPMVTGGVIIVSTLVCYLGKNKPKKKEIYSVVLAFAGLLILFLMKS